MKETERTEVTGPITPDVKRAVRFCVLLTVLAALFYPLPALMAFMNYGVDGLVAAALTGGACWLGAVSALALIGVTQGPENGVSGILGGKLLGMGIPLATITVVLISGFPVPKMGMLVLVIVYFLPTLAVQTILAVRLVNASSHSVKTTLTEQNNDNADTKAF